MRKKVQNDVIEINPVDSTPLPEGVVIKFDTSIKPLELNHGLHVSREEFNELVGKLNEIIKKVN